MRFAKRFIMKNLMNITQRFWRWRERGAVDAALAQAAAVHPQRAQMTKQLVGLDQVHAAWRLQGGDGIGQQPNHPESWVWSCDGLAAFFDAWGSEPLSAPFALPSRAVDQVWRAWWRMDQAGFDGFCMERVGRRFARGENGRLRTPPDTALGRCWTNNCRAEGVDPMAGILPSLFALDVKLGIPGGQAYRINPDTGGLRKVRLDRHGMADYARVAELANVRVAPQMVRAPARPLAEDGKLQHLAGRNEGNWPTAVHHAGSQFAGTDLGTLPHADDSHGCRGGDD